MAHNNPLSEAAILGFEYGYRLANPDAPFAGRRNSAIFNGAQVIIDQFISSAERKWLRMSGIVMLLPHGYEGRGPEHSSALTNAIFNFAARTIYKFGLPSTPS